MIKLLYSSPEGPCGETLDHQILIEGLTIGDETVFINLLIDIDSKSSTPADYRPSIRNLRHFNGKSRTINIIEEIGSNYFDFGVMLLNDENGNHIRAIEQFSHNYVDVIKEIVREWSNGRDGAKAFQWSALIETLQDVGLRRLANEIESSLRTKS